MRSCPQCKGFVPPRLGQCPHCDASMEVEVGGMRLRDKIVSGLLASSAAMTLMACYGAPPCLDDECLFDPDTGSTDSEGEECDPSGVAEQLDEQPPVSVDGMLSGDQGSNQGTCAIAAGDEVIYEWTAPAPGPYRIAVDSATDTVLYVRAGGDGVCGEELACDDDSNGDNPELILDLTTDPVVIVVDSVSPNASAFTLTIEAQ